MHEAHERPANMTVRGDLYWTLLGWFVLLGWPLLYTLSDSWGPIAYVGIIVYWVIRPRGFFEFRVLAWPLRKLKANLRDFFFEEYPPAADPPPVNGVQFDIVCRACGSASEEYSAWCDCGAEMRRTARRIPRQA